MIQFEAMKGLPLTRNFMLQLCDALVFKPMWRPRELASIYRGAVGAKIPFAIICQRYKIPEHKIFY